MASRKKVLELIFNLQWINKPDNGSDKSNVIGMYDTPATTLNFETFKSYLLKNSGVAENDVKVTYITDDGAEWVIESQEGFQTALCAFRLKARLAEVIFLKLDKISGSSKRPQMICKHSNDVQTQFDNESAPNGLGAPPEWFISYMKQFKSDVVEEITFAITNSVSVGKETASAAANVSRRVKPESSKRSRKHLLLGEASNDKELLKTLKFDRKLEVKLDKLEAKNKKIKDKRQALINKINKTLNSDGFHEGKHFQVPTDVDGKPLLNASLVRETSVVPHMMGGETYLHTWEVVNNGKLPWTPKTVLRLTWGSAEMKTSTDVIRCPSLQPGEKGTLCVRFEIPKKPGQYESYWNFYDNGRRFGQWLSCCVIIDGLKSTLADTIFASKKPKIEEHLQQNIFPETQFPQYCVSLVPEKTGAVSKSPQTTPENVSENKEQVIDDQAIDVSSKMQALRINSLTCLDSDSDCESFWPYGPMANKTKVDDGKAPASDDYERFSGKYGIAEEDLIVDLSKNSVDKNIATEQVNSEKQPGADKNFKPEGDDDKVAKPVEDDSNNNNNNGASVHNSSGESMCEVESEASSDLSSSYDIVTAPVDDEKEDESSGYVYVIVDGNKIAIPKHILYPDYVPNVESAPSTKKTLAQNNVLDGTNDDLGCFKETNLDSVKAETEILQQQCPPDPKSVVSHCSATGTCFSDANQLNSRLFIFPQTNPGYEVVASKRDDNMDSEKVFCPTNKVEVLPSDPLQTYTWADSQTRYTLADFQSGVAAPNVASVKSDFYGPQEHSRCTSSQSSSAGTFPHVPNYQQTPRPSQFAEYQNTNPTAPPQTQYRTAGSPPVQNVPVHILPENLVTGAVNVASSAINTARSVINMIVPPKSQPGKWVNGHWISENPESTRAKGLRILSEMGFWDTDLNATLLARYNDDINRVVSELLQ